MLRSVLKRKSKKEGVALPENANVHLVPELSHNLWKVLRIRNRPMSTWEPATG